MFGVYGVCLWRFGLSWSRRFAAVIPIYTRPLVRVYPGLPSHFRNLPLPVYRGLPLMPCKLPHTLSTKLAASELKSLQARAHILGLTQSEYLRLLVLAELQSVNEQSLLQAVEAEHTRLVLIAAQQGKALNATTLRELRSQAIVNAPTLVEQTIRVLKQQRNGGQ